MSRSFFDTHAHYFDGKFETLEGGAEGVLNSPDFRASVCGVINAGTNLQNCEVAIRQAAQYPFMYAAVGIHPEDCQRLSLDPDATLAALEDMVADEATRRRDKIVAIGEIGLDYYWEPVDKPLQKAFFEGQLALAEKYDLPVLIHDREAHGDCFETVLKYPRVRGVFHGYSGSAEMARELTRRGWYIAFGGTVTFKNAERVRSVAASVPMEHLVLETDCPYMAPVPLRGRVCHSGMIPHIAEVIADLHGISADEVAAITTRNAETLFGLSTMEKSQ